MSIKIKTSAQAVVLVCCMLWISPGHVWGATPPNSDVIRGSQLLEAKIDFLISSLASDIQATGRTDIVLSDTFKENSGIARWIRDVTNAANPIYEDVKKTGQLHDRGDPLEAD